jgi:hypothetical protein
LSKDPIQKLLVDGDLTEGKNLKFQPSLSRFENSVRRSDLADLVISHQAERLNDKARRITIDSDPTDDPTQLEKRARRLMGKARMRSWASGKAKAFMRQRLGRIGVG